MDNTNPADMSNEDLEKDMEQKNNEKTGQEHVQKTTATEGRILDPSEDPASVQNISSGKAQELDSAGNIKTEDSQDGSGPDPEDIDLWENDDKGDKMSS
ncbi:MAG: hypothetical protein JWQ40_5197 [Segetibacter sp.]|jgi:hypothetical protein|nr:hypothetical protein [Segetibacter sp.]